MTVHERDDAVDESGTFSAGASSSGTQTINFGREFRAASASLGPAGGASLLGTLTAEWSSWNRDAAGNIVGMDVLYDNSDTVSHDVNWSVIGDPI